MFVTQLHLLKFLCQYDYSLKNKKCVFLLKHSVHIFFSIPRLWVWCCRSAWDGTPCRVPASSCPLSPTQTHHDMPPSPAGRTRKLRWPSSASESNRWWSVAVRRQQGRRSEQ